jgi:branched-chain amino acid transport system permease protein
VWILAGIGISCLVAFLIGVPSLRLRGHYLAMATLGFGVIVHEIAVARESAGGVYGFPDLSLFGFVIDTDARWYFLVWGTLCVFTLLSLHLIHSRVGRALRSIHGNELAARAVGVNISFYKIQIFVLSAAMASLAGSYHAHHEIVVGSSSFGFHTSIVVVVMVVVGGMSNVWAALLGAVFISLLEEKLRAYPDWMTFIYGTILILVMIFAPRGIFLTLASGARRVWARWGWTRKTNTVTPGVPGG